MPLPARVTQDMRMVLRPSMLFSSAIYHFVMTVFEIVFVERAPSKLLSLTQVRYRSFASLWAANGEAMSATMPGHLDSLLRNCAGLVLDVGPGSGVLLSRFNPQEITAIYGVEPAEELHAALEQNAIKANLDGRFHALICGAEPNSLIPALHKSGLLGDGMADQGVFDEICCVRVLCGVPHLRETLQSLYTLLKPGGRMVVCEHVVNPWRNEGRVIARVLQALFTLMGWPFFLGGCELQRDTETYLREAGEWSEFKLVHVDPRDSIPFIVGELKKASKPTVSNEE
ncbi:S-adenosyl-L-methionine-dependent methyltransferase [Pleomassaria siparia CBS 279.74]|uniref:S-adenosyl-L-methionine-dependent methyltransferase n=1 Tax=Pleomassaria siparia CBS 279.74 TaxID=1314801 RepID=A0A6G1KHV2_9PLEO|nr:S-adenosyl-L-methionine-dependent methyltransferase [Pleomassaria siparia CBS 279.74]